VDAVLDSGGVTAWAARRPPQALLNLLVEVARTGGALVVPTVTIVESTTGRQQDDARLNWRLRSAELDDCTASRARQAAALRFRAPRGPSAVDAVVAATAIDRSLAVVVTSDPDDLGALLASSSRSIPVLPV
jgi:predicted nucleic acid-binding protein